MCGAAAIAGIVDSAHDFSDRAWNTEGEICKPCHIPHNAQTEDGGGSMVLWNHALTEQDFTMYSPFAVDRADRDQQEVELGGPSKLCLSCHDGVTAVDNYGGSGGTTETITGSANLGTDLRNDHPIGIQYPADGTAAGYHNKANLGPELKLSTWTLGATLKTDRVECSSCHDPHDDANGTFLRMSNTGSDLCMKCHDK
jgi:predicted CXXCH cytochrome family protein